METKIYNIDSSINRNKTENSNNFTYTTYTNSYINKIDNMGKINKIRTTNIEPFNEKNVYEINILSFELNEIFNIIIQDLLIPIVPVVCNTDIIPEVIIKPVIVIEPTSIYEPVIPINGIIIEPTYPIIPIIDIGTIIEPIYNPVINPIIDIGTIIEPNIMYEPILPLFPENKEESFIKTSTYFFLRINDLGNITNFNKKNGNINYVAKIVVEKLTNFTSYTYKIITAPIILEQPMDIKFLKISLENKDGDLIGIVRDANGFIILDKMKDINYSFTLELKIITNSILKDYKQIKFYSEPVMERLLQAKMLAYFEARVDVMTNNTLTNNYMSNLVNLNNIEEYTPLGNRNNYINPNNSSIFTNMDKRV